MTSYSSLEEIHSGPSYSGPGILISVPIWPSPWKVYWEEMKYLQGVFFWSGYYMTLPHFSEPGRPDEEELTSGEDAFVYVRTQVDQSAGLW